jgi:hypothetical protein
VKILALIRFWPRKFGDGGIDHRPIVANDGAGRQACHIDMRFPENVHHLLARGEKAVGNDPAVAAPPDRFSAHHRAPVLTTSFPEPGQAGGEGRRQGVVRIVSKAAHAPISIGRWFSVARLSPEAAELGDMLVADLPWRQRFREALLIEPRVGTRPRHRPYVDNEVDAGLLQEIGKFDDRPGRVANGEKGVRVAAPTDEGA